MRTKNILNLIFFRDIIKLYKSLIIFFKACAKTKKKNSSSIKQQNQVTKGAQFSICYSTRKCKTKILKKICPNTNMLSQSQMQETAEDSTALIMNIIASSINHSREEILHPSSVVAHLFLSLFILYHLNGHGHILSNISLTQYILFL